MDFACADGDGLVTAAEFIPVYMRATASTDLARTMFIYFRIDRDESGTVATAEVDTLFDSFDTNGRCIFKAYFICSQRRM